MLDPVDQLPPPGSIPAAVAVGRAALAGVAHAPGWSLGGVELLDVVVELTRLRAQVDELAARLLGQAVETGAEQEAGSTSTAAWLAAATRQTRTAAHRQVREAAALAGHEPTRTGMAEGRVNADQAGVITRAVDLLPVEHRAVCEAHLVELAADHDARSLKVLGRHVLDVVDPDAADAFEAARLAAEEAEADRRTRLTWHDDGDGTVRGTFCLPALEGQQLRTALLALAAPKHVRATGGTYDHAVPTPQRWGQALREYVSRYPVDRLPQAGGVAATVMVTMELSTLLGDVRSAIVGDQPISPGQARQLACEAGIIPVVLGGAGVVLDEGRAKRFHTPAQRRAITLEQRHCQHGDCDVPAALCHVHHREWWQRDRGETNTHDAELLCPRHHRLIHQQAPPRHLRIYTVHRL